MHKIVLANAVPLNSGTACLLELFDANKTPVNKISGVVRDGDCIETQIAVPACVTEVSVMVVGQQFANIKIKDAKPSRTYGLIPSATVRDGKGYRFLNAMNEKFEFVSRVEFDEDADEGMARITFCPLINGQPLLDYEKSEACSCTIRTWVRAIPPGQPLPEPNRNAVLYRTKDGRITRHEQDPLPDELFSGATA